MMTMVDGGVETTATATAARRWCIPNHNSVWILSRRNALNALLRAIQQRQGLPPDGLDSNEELLRHLAFACQAVPIPDGGYLLLEESQIPAEDVAMFNVMIREKDVLSALIVAPHVTPSLFDLIAAACPYGITKAVIAISFHNQRYTISREIQETLLRVTRSKAISIQSSCQDTLRMAIRTADRNPHIRSIHLKGAALTPTVIADLGQATSFQKVRLSANHHPDQESALLLTAAMMEMLRTNHTMTSLTLSSVFHSSLCTGIVANRHCALTSLHLHASGNDDFLAARRRESRIARVGVVCRRFNPHQP
jgi:hypothetical protein